MEKFSSKAKSASVLFSKDLNDIGVYLAPYLAKSFSTVLEGKAHTKCLVGISNDFHV